jgi:hypothetical protein
VSPRDERFSRVFSSSSVQPVIVAMEVETGFKKALSDFQAPPEYSLPEKKPRLGGVQAGDCLSQSIDF